MATRPDGTNVYLDSPQDRMAARSDGTHNVTDPEQDRMAARSDGTPNVTDPEQDRMATRPDGTSTSDPTQQSFTFSNPVVLQELSATLRSPTMPQPPARNEHANTQSQRLVQPQQQPLEEGYVPLSGQVTVNPDIQPTVQVPSRLVSGTGGAVLPASTLGLMGLQQPPMPVGAALKHQPLHQPLLTQSSGIAVQLHPPWLTYCSYSLA